jgi:hypothetical protein
MSVSAMTLKPAAVDPNLTPVVPVNPQPTMETTVPPPVGPDAGLMLLMAGAPPYPGLQYARLIPFSPTGLVRSEAAKTPATTKTGKSPRLRARFTVF